MTGTSGRNLPALEFYKALVDHMPNGVLVLFDADLRYVVVGPAVLPFSGRDATDLMDHTIDELFSAETVQALRPRLESTLEGETHSFDLDFDSLTHHIETRPMTLDGESYGVLLTQEVTAERETATTLERQNERLDQFASMLSHDIKNPLSIAIGRLELYNETGDDEHLDDVEDALHRIEDLVVDLMGLARHGAPTNEHAEVSLTAVAEAAWNNTETRSATLETEDGAVVGDAGQLQALFENLFRNAVGHGGDTVTVRVGQLTGGFYVEDTGPGIPAERRREVFEHGFTTGYSGSGVGLTIVQRIAESHEFDIELTESPEGGARFEFLSRDAA